MQHFRIVFFHLVSYMQVSSMSFHDSIAHFLSALNNLPLCGHIGGLLLFLKKVFNLCAMERPHKVLRGGA